LNADDFESYVRQFDPKEADVIFGSFTKLRMACRPDEFDSMRFEQSILNAPAV
jgi:hypothetical protein